MTFYTAELSMYTNDSLMQNQTETDERITRDFWVEEQHNQAGIPDKKHKKQYENKTKQNKKTKKRNEI